MSLTKMAMKEVVSENVFYRSTILATLFRKQHKPDLLSKKWKYN